MECNKPPNIFMLEPSILLFTHNGSDYTDFKSVNTCNAMNSKLNATSVHRKKTVKVFMLGYFLDLGVVKLLWKICMEFLCAKNVCVGKLSGSIRLQTPVLSNEFYFLLLICHPENPVPHRIIITNAQQSMSLSRVDRKCFRVACILKKRTKILSIQLNLNLLHWSLIKFTNL